MIIKILSWNVRGVNDAEKRKLIKSVIRSQRAELVCLQETKVQTMTMNLVKSLGVGSCLKWVSVNANGAVGEILVFSDFRVLELVDLKVGEFSISCRFRNCEDDFMWVFTGVYGPCSWKDKEGLWEELGAIRGLWNDLWCVGGDFNAIRFLVERTNGSRLNAQMRRFLEVINDFEVIH